MANTLLTPSVITKEALVVLENSLTFTKLINRQYDSRFAITGAKIGTTLDVRKPARYTVRTGPTLAPQNYTETSVPLTLNYQKGCDVVFTTAELTLSLDDFRDRVLKPQIATVANEVDRLALLLYLDVYNYVGVPGTIPNDLFTYLSAGAVLAEEAAPMDEYINNVIGPRMQAKIVDGLKGLFNSVPRLKEQYERGRMDGGGPVAGANWYMDQNIATHTVGALGGTPLVNGASQTGASVITDGWTAAAATRLHKGDVVQFDGVYAVNPQSRVTTGQLRNFVVTADTASDGSGNLTIPISPSIITSGAFQTVTNSPANNAAVTIFGHASTYADKVSPQGMWFHRDAFTLACADLVMPGGVDFAARASDDQLGLSIRMVRAYDINNDALPCRIDILFGLATLRAELACRVLS